MTTLSTETVGTVTVYRGDHECQRYESASVTDAADIIKSWGLTFAGEAWASDQAGQTTAHVTDFDGRSMLAIIASVTASVT